MHNPTSNNRTEKGSFFYGYIIVVVGALILIIQGGAQFSFGVFLKPLVTEFGWTRAETAGAYSLYWIFFALFSIFAGRLTDRFGPRLVVTVCGLLLSLSYFLMSQINSIWQFYLLYGILLSLGLAGVFVTLFSTVARWFTAKRGLASGIVMAGSGIGMITFPPLASYLITSYSWRISYMVIAALALMIPIIFAQFLKREPGHARETVDISNESTNNSSLMTQGHSLQQAIHTRQLWLMSGIFFVTGLCLQAVMAHIVAHATDAGIPATVAATIISAIGIVSTASKVGAGAALDRLQSKRILIILAILMSISFLLLQLSGELWLLYLFAVIFAVSYGGFATAMSPLVAEYFGLRAHGTILGIILFANGMGCAAGPYITGLVFDVTGSYNLAFWGYAILCMVAVLLSFLLRPIDKNFIDGK